MPKTCDNWLGLVNIYVYYTNQTREMHQVPPYSMDFNDSGELWNQLSKTVLSIYSFIWNKEPVNIWYDRKVQR